MDTYLKKMHHKIVLLAKSKLNSTDVLILKALIDSYISHDEFVSVNNVLTESNNLKEEIKSLKLNRRIQSRILI